MDEAVQNDDTDRVGKEESREGAEAIRDFGESGQKEDATLTYICG